MGFMDKYARSTIGSTDNLLLQAASGNVDGANFSGNPKKYTVTLEDAQPDANYTVTISGEDARTWSVESRTTTSFVINSNANTALTGQVHWQLAGDI